MSNHDLQNMEDLLKALHHRASSVRAGAVRRLSGLDNADARVIAGLVEALDDTTLPVAEIAIDALISLGTPAVAPLIEVVEDRTASMGWRMLAIRVLAYIHDARAYEPLVTVLRDRSEEEQLRLVAALYLGRLRDRRAVPALLDVAGAHDEARQVRRTAVVALGELRDPETIEALVQILTVESDETIRAWLIRTLGQLGDERALEPLLQLLRNGSPEDQQWAAQALRTLGAIAEPAVLDLLAHPDAQVRRAALSALPLRPDEHLMARLLTILDQDYDAGVRAAAARALGWVGRENHGIVDRLIALLTREDEPLEVRQATGLALRSTMLRGWIVDEAALEALHRTCRAEDAQLRHHAVAALGAMAGRQLRLTAMPLDERIVTALIEAVGDTDAHVSQTVAQTLGGLGDERAVPALIHALTRYEELGIARAAAAHALGRLRATTAVGALVEALRDPDHRVRIAVAQALGQIGATQAVPPLIQALEDVNNAVRVASCGALGRLGDLQALPALERALQNGEGRGLLTTVRDAAASAIEHLMAHDGRQLGNASP